MWLRSGVAPRGPVQFHLLLDLLSYMVMTLGGLRSRIGQRFHLNWGLTIRLIPELSGVLHPWVPKKVLLGTFKMLTHHN
jgi:hypothetical protein